MFKNSVLDRLNPYRKMIMGQIDDFLKYVTDFERIQVIRKLRCITLQIDQTMAVEKAPEISKHEAPEQTFPIQQLKEEIFIFNEGVNQIQEDEHHDEDHPMGEDFDYEEIISGPEDQEDVVNVISEYISCSKCNEISSSATDQEIHEFFNHSTIGLQINDYVDSCKNLEESSYKCVACSLTVNEPTLLANHFLIEHTDDFINSVSAANSFSDVAEYTNVIKDLLLQPKDEDILVKAEVDDKLKQEFYKQYGNEITVDEEPEMLVEPDILVEPEIIVEPEILVEPEIETRKEKKVVDPESQEWIRKEITLRKKTVRIDNGSLRVIYQCAYCTKYTSNSTNGFRYHLTSKHLKSGQPDKVVQSMDITPEFGKQMSGKKNICEECNLKFKDQKHLKNHMICHELFETVSSFYLFAKCNTCNKIFIDENSYNIHLMIHEDEGDLTQPIEVPPGAVIMQSSIKISGMPESKSSKIMDVPHDEFSWNCGHCQERFLQQDACNFHLLMKHTSAFVCPVDKRDFSGFKAMSLFCHHLRNKHSELFPDLTFSCTFCKREFPSIYDKLSHMKNCSVKKFSCDHCGKKFFRKSELSNHLKFVSGELCYPCLICSKKFETNTDMKIHMRCHTKVKPFPCTVCSKSFRTQAARSTHMENHNTSLVFKVSHKVNEIKTFINFRCFSAFARKASSRESCTDGI